MELKYIGAVQSGQWKAARNVADTKQPNGFFANPEVTTVQSTMSRGNSGAGWNGIVCYNCNKPGHDSKFCLKKRGQDNGKSGGNNSGGGNIGLNNNNHGGSNNNNHGGTHNNNGAAPGWRVTPPSGNGPKTLQRNNKTYH